MIINSLFVEITNKCNKKCSYCYNNMDKNIKNTYISKQNIINLINQAQKMNIESIILSGGEPTLYPELEYITEYILKKQFSCKINSNAYNQNRLIDLVNQNINDRRKLQFQFTVDGYKSIHDKYRGEGDYNKVIDTVKLLRMKGHNGTISIRYNIHDYVLEDIGNVIENFNQSVDYILISSIYGDSNAVVSIQNYMDIYNYINKIKNNSCVISLFIPPLSCTLSYINENTVFSPLIDTHGNVYLCQMAVYNPDFCLGNIKRNLLADILTDIRLNKVVDRIKKYECKNTCIIKNICQGGCKGLCKPSEGDGFCELRKKLFLQGMQIKKYQCWS